MDNQIDIQKRRQALKWGKWVALGMVGAVYVGAVLVFTVMVASFIVGVFPADAFFTRAAALIGAVLVSLSALAFPVALMFWATRSWHRWLAFAFYGLDMIILALNVTVAFNSLRGMPPAWVLQYEPYSVTMLIYPLVAWGVLLAISPEEKNTVELGKAQSDFELKVIQQMSAWLESPEGQDEVFAAAREVIPQVVSRQVFRKAAPGVDRVVTGVVTAPAYGKDVQRETLNEDRPENP